MAPTVKRAEILDYSILQVVKWLQSEFKKFSGKDLTSGVVTGPNQLRQLSAKFNMGVTEEGAIKETKLSYPYMLYSIGDISIDETAGALNKRQGHSLVMSKDIDANTASMINARRVKLALGVNFNTSDFGDVLSFAHALLMNVPAVSFYMEVPNTTFRIGTKLNLSPSLSTPPVNTETPGEAYQFETLLTLDTYIGVMYDQRLIREVVFRVVEPNNEVFYNGDPSKDVEELVFNKIRFTDYFDSSKLMNRG